MPSARLVLAGYGFDASGPHLVLNVLDSKERYKLPVAGNRFLLERLDARYCTGRFDLESFEAECCPHNAELPDDYKDTSCPECLEATGFNPSFYHAQVVSSKQLAYNATPHFVYMVFFAENLVKVGISATSRNIERLLEQGARAAMLLGVFDNADEARLLEEALCGHADIIETLRSSKKSDLIRENTYNVAEAEEVLTSYAQKYQLEPLSWSVLVEGEDTKLLDLQKYYLVEDLPRRALHTSKAFSAQVCGGLCIGMIGSNLIFKQEEEYLVFSLKSWDSHLVKLALGPSNFAFDIEPTQISLF